MPSPADRRLLLERVCRAGALAALAALLLLPVRPQASERLESSGTPTLADILTAATLRPVATVNVRLSELPGAATRAWLLALRGAGTDVRWQATDSLPRTVVSAEPVPGPDNPRRIALSGLSPGSFSLRDALGVVDSGTTTSVSAREVVAQGSGPVVVDVAGATLRAPDVRPAIPRAVLVIGRAGWEARFTTAALEESGWTVESEFVITPRGPAGRAPDAGRGAVVRTRGAGSAIDTSRYAAVVALDGSAASRASAIARFVGEGGGLILGHEAAVGNLRALAPAGAGESFRETLGGLMTATPRRGLGGRVLRGLRPDAVALERSGTAVTMAARRHELGRVLMVGYDQLWRWRMQGGETSPEDHRAWWSGLVSSVAYSPVVQAPTLQGDPAPLAALNASLGPPGNAAWETIGRHLPWTKLLFAACLLLLMIEWTSRRLRGAP